MFSLLRIGDAPQVGKISARCQEDGCRFQASVESREESCRIVATPQHVVSETWHTGRHVALLRPCGSLTRYNRRRGVDMHERGGQTCVVADDTVLAEGRSR